MEVANTERSRRLTTDNETKLNTSLSHTQSRCQITALKRNQTCVFCSFLNLNSYSLLHSLSLLLLYVCLLDSAYEWFCPFFALLNCAFIYSSLFLSLCIFSLLNVLTSNVWHFSRTLDPRASFKLFAEIFPCFVESAIKNILYYEALGTLE